MSVRRGLAAFAVPVAILAAAQWLAAYAASWPPAYVSMAGYAPAWILVLGALLAAAFQRGRIFFALLTLAVAWFAYRGYLSRGISGFTARTVFVSLCVFIPVNLAVLALTRERGIFNLHGLLRTALIALECGAAAWLITAGNRETVDWLYQPLSSLLPTATRIPQAGLMLMTGGVLTGIGCWWLSRSAIDLGFAGAIAAWGLAAHHAARPEMDLSYVLFSAAAALMLVIAVLQDVYRMAFRDELTGVPGRRALNEHLARLGRRYVIAVLDIDHFKKFNDTHGHDVGDQVLKMVATRIERVRGGGSAYRFGGEEFVIVFPGATVAQAMPLLEALRIDVAQHGLTLRASDRPSKTPSRNLPVRKPRAGGKKLSVTISIGVAEHNEKRSSPSDVLAAADKALYRAKRAGRNRVNR